jgi:flavin reductase (DIM6/NTAB) family NADH-FMN oxidoreductase RutF
MKPNYKKSDFPVSHIRKHLEPGPVVLVSSKFGDKDNIMTMGWHMVMDFTPSLISCIISSGNYSYDLIRKSGECVINIPTSELIKKVISIGTTSGHETDKFDTFGLTRQLSNKVTAPGIKECYANLECIVSDSTQVNKYNLFIFEVIYASIALRPKNPKTIHYRGKGHFMIAGKTLSFPKQFPSEYS